MPVRSLVLLGCVVGVLAVAAPADACGYRRHAAAHRSARGHRPPLILGDSTMIFATPRLGALGLEADAKECRQFTEGVDMLAARRHAGTLPRLAILALGANGPIDGASLQRALDIMGPHRILGLVTPRNLTESAAVMRRAARAHPLRVLLVDWAADSAGHGGWFAGDGLHVNFTGARAFADDVRRAAAPLLDEPPSSLPDSSGGEDTKDCGQLHRFRAHLAVFVLRGTEKLTCAQARALARRSPLRRIPGWRTYDRPGTGRPPWRDVYVRADGEVAVGVRDAPSS